jgi:co-chaperonin GroES (HSP10)
MNKQLAEINVTDIEFGIDVPITPLGWRVLIQPYQPDPMSEGGIAIPEEAIDNTRILTSVGRIVAMGNKAFTAKTRAGIDMSEIEPMPKVGDWVVFGAYGGLKITRRNGTEYRLLNDDAIMAIARNPKELQFYV